MALQSPQMRRIPQAEPQLSSRGVWQYLQQAPSWQPQQAPSWQPEKQAPSWHFMQQTSAVRPRSISAAATSVQELDVGPPHDDEADDISDDDDGDHGQRKGLQEVQKSQVTEEDAHSSGSNFVFVQRFPMARSRLVPRWIRRVLPFYHTDILVCPRSSFSEDDQRFLDEQIRGMADFSKIPKSWWGSKTEGCVQIGYGYGDCSEKCCNVMQVDKMPLNNESSVVAGLDYSKKDLFVYGTSDTTGQQAHRSICDPLASNHNTKFWSNWDGIDFHIYGNNCNTFTAIMLNSVFGLSKKKPAEDLADVGFYDTATTRDMVRETMMGPEFASLYGSKDGIGPPNYY